MEESMNETRKYGGFALALFSGGLILPLILVILAQIFAGPKAVDTVGPLAGLLAFICEVLALVFGVLGWQEKACKAVVGLVGGLLLLFFGAGFFWFLMGKDSEQPIDIKRAPSPKPVAAPLAND